MRLVFFSFFTATTMIGLSCSSEALSACLNGGHLTALLSLLHAFAWLRAPLFLQGAQNILQGSIWCAGTAYVHPADRAQAGPMLLLATRASAGGALHSLGRDTSADHLPPEMGRLRPLPTCSRPITG